MATSTMIARSTFSFARRRQRVSPHLWLQASCAGGARVPQKFWFVENPGKIPENPCKSGQNYENVRKLPDNTDKIGAQLGKNHMKTFFGGHLINDEILKYSHKELSENFSGKFGKNLCTPKFSCCYTYTLMLPTMGILRRDNLELQPSPAPAFCFTSESETVFQTRILFVARARYSLSWLSCLYN